jgi:hypothetical protein
MTMLWLERLVVAVQPGAVRPEAVADSNPPSVMSCEVALTVSETAVVSVNPPPVPVTVTVAVPMVAVALAASVRVELPAPVMLAGLKLEVTPAGNPPAVKDTALVNPPVTAVVTVVAALAPWVTVRDAGDAEIVKPEDVPPVMVSVTAVVSVSAPPVPVTVTVEVPAAALPLAVRVSVDEPAPPEMLAGLKLAVTPVGRPPAVSATALLNPPETALVIVDDPELPAAMLREAGLAERVKIGVPPVTIRLTAVELVRLPAVPTMPIR